MRHPLKTYDIKTLASNKSLAIETTLIKKLSNWQRQHSNGIKVLFNSSVITFSQIKALTFQLKLDVEQSTIPKIPNMNAQYAKYVTQGLVKPEWFTEMYSELGYINITLFGEHHENQNIRTSLASYQLSLTSEMTQQPNDNTLKLTDFTLIQQQYWQDIAIGLDQIANHKIMGMLITAETKNQKTLRSYLQSNYPDTIPELFLELAINMSDIAMCR